MKTLIYFEEFLPPDLLNEAILLSKNVEYSWTNQAKRSLSSNVTKNNFLEKYINHLETSFNFSILAHETSFYKRNNDIFNPHRDPCKLNLLIYLTGDTVDIENGTFFMNENSDKMAIKVSNVLNSAILFNSDFTHGSIQALNPDSTWRYSLNTFIYDLSPNKAI
jgi:hypothetical protein